MKPILEIQSLSKKFIINKQKQPYLTIREQISNSFRPRESSKGEFWALKDVSFDVMPGDSIGIIGKNGAGKSTLLKVLSKITPPTSGKIVLRGRVASLLEVGTGFHSELSGRENVYLNGSILGMKKREIDKQFNNIVDFSGVELFIDTPLKHYSSGMQLRLAFAVAAFLEPEVLVIDEVLAVGDAEFQKRCLKKMDDVSRSGRTILFVSHNMGALASLCKKAVLLEKGTKIAEGETGKVIANYLSSMSQGGNGYYSDNNKDSSSWITRVLVCNGDNESKLDFDISEEIAFKISYCINKCIKDFNIELNLYRNQNCVFTSFNTDKPCDEAYLSEGNHEMEIVIPKLFLKAGSYSVRIALRRITDGSHFHELNEAVNFTISETFSDFTQKGFKEERLGDVIFNGNWNLK